MTDIHAKADKHVPILFPETQKFKLFIKTFLGNMFISGLTFNDMVNNITSPHKNKITSIL